MKKIGLILSVGALSLTVGCIPDEFKDLLPFEDQLSLDVDAIDAYLEENEIAAQEDDSGIRFVMIEEGDGARPSLDDNIRISYVGTYFDGVEFDSNEDATFNLGLLIRAWQIMMPQMRAGGRMVIYAPSGYCYGAFPPSGIRENANMIFDIELIEVFDLE